MEFNKSKITLKKGKEVIYDIVIIIVGSIISLFSFQAYNNYQSNNKVVNILNASIQSINNKEIELSHLNLSPLMLNYKPSDTLLVYNQPIYFEYEKFYDKFLQSDEMNLILDSEFFKQINDFQIRHEKLKNLYISRKNDSLRKMIKNNIVLQIKEEKDILKGEVNYLNGVISKDSLTKIRQNTFRKYIIPL
ncbi:hypothetical protein HER15_14240 [Tenacibaculum mesophilum]|uniref:Uncharacterized protein n=1 Tax=Tenacibaculum mesophilum TaxID=104268 RepID=A0AAE9MRQ6_9FLAO|nr:hypothetical protein [Tenacibaculum mesophilum]UTD16565.1 hypothetical protein HER15_14240 [Tenacibaculum mesophilum]